MRSPEDIAAIIDRYNLADRDSLHELEAHIRRDLPIREVLFFADFLHGGDFTSSSGKWRRESSGYVTQTHQEDSALTRLWSALVRSAHFYIGAASVLKMQGARLLAGYAFADEGDGPTLYDFTLDQLVRAVPKEYHKQLKEYRKQLDAASKLDAILAATADLKAQGAELKKDVAVVGRGVKGAARKQLTLEHYDRVNGIKPPTRDAGGGRKKERDLDDAQVKAVLALSPAGHRRPIMECCAEILRKSGEYQNPYDKSKDLAAAVRRYCKRTKMKATFANHTGRWSARS